MGHVAIDDDDDDETQRESEYLQVIDEATIDTHPDFILRMVQRKRMAQLFNKEGLDKVEMQLMSDLTKTALAEKRIDVDQNLGDGILANAAALAALVAGSKGVRPTGGGVAQQPAFDDSFLPDETIDTDEICTDNIEVTYDEVMAAEALKE